MNKAARRHPKRPAKKLNKNTFYEFNLEFNWHDFGDPIYTWILNLCFECLRKNQSKRPKPETLTAKAFLYSLIPDFLQSDTYKGFTDRFMEIRPYLEKELTLSGQENNLLTISIEDFAEIVKKASAAFSATKKTTSAGSKKITALQFPFAKINNDIFSALMMESADKTSLPGQLAFTRALAVESGKDKRNGIERTICYSLSFDSILKDAKITKALTQYDRRIYDAISSLYDAGNKKMSASMIYRAMGNKGQPDSNAVAKITQSIKYMATGWLRLDQSTDYSLYTQDKLSIEAHLLDVHIGKMSINGKTTEAGFVFLSEPVLFTLALARKQITTIPFAILDTGKKQTERYISIETFMLERIARMKNGKEKSSNRIKYSSLFDTLQITAKNYKAKERALATMYDLLEHYKKNEWIKGYKENINSKNEPCAEIFF